MAHKGDFDAERQLLYAGFCNAGTILRVAAIVDETMFTSDVRNSEVFGAMRRLVARGEAVTDLTVRDELRGSKAFGTPQKTLDYIVGLQDGPFPNLAAIERIAEMVRSAEMDRRLRSIFATATAKLDDGDRADAVSAFLVSEALRLARPQNKAARYMGDVVHEVLQEQEADHALGNVPFLRCGIRNFDRARVFRRRILSALVGPSKHGKSAMVINLLRGFLREQESSVVMLVSLEMSKTEVTHRLLSIETQIPLSMIQSFRLTGEQFKRLTAADRELNSETMKHRFYFCDNVRGIDDICTQVLRVKAEAGRIDAVAIDYINLVKHNVRERERYREVTRIAEDLFDLAKVSDSCVIAAAQVNRDRENRIAHELMKRDGKGDARAAGRIRNSDVKEAGAIFETARSAVTFFRPWQDVDETYRAASGLRACEVEAEVLANNEGVTGHTTLHLDLVTQTLASDANCADVKCQSVIAPTSAVLKKPKKPEEAQMEMSA